MKVNIVFLQISSLLLIYHVSNVGAYYSNNNTDNVNCGSFALCNQCLNESGCGWCTTERKCQLQDSYCQAGLIYDKCPPFFSVDRAIGTVLIFLGGILTSGGGLGGGGIYIPILVLVLGRSPHVAVPLSKITIFGIGVGGFIILSRKRHPKANRPLIDFDTAFLMEPMTLLGSILGVYMNIIFPSYLIIIFLVIVLGYNAYKTITKGITLYKEEKKPVELKDTASDSLLDQAHNPQLEEILQKESKLPWWQMSVLGALEIGMLAFMFVKGGSGIGPKFIECGSLSYWGLVVATVPYLVCFTVLAGKYLRRKHERKVSAGFRFMDVQWTHKKTIVLPIIFVMAGVAAGFLGIGAGLVVGPIFLEMGMVPQVAVATSSYMILFTSFSTTAQFLIMGGLPWEDAVWYFFVGVFAAMIGQYGLAEFIKRYKKQAFINFFLGGLIAFSVIMMGILEGKTVWVMFVREVGIDVVRDVTHHRSMGFNSICPGKN